MLDSQARKDTDDIEKFSEYIVKNHGSVEGYYETPLEEHIPSMNEMIKMMSEMKVGELENFLNIVKDYENVNFVNMVRAILEKRTVNHSVA